MKNKNTQSQVNFPTSYTKKSLFFTELLSLKEFYLVSTESRILSRMPVEAVVRRGSVKNLFLEISQSSQKNTCVRDSLNKVAGSATLLKKSHWYRYFSVNFSKFLRTLFLKNTSSGCFCLWSVLIVPKLETGLVTQIVSGMPFNCY